MYQHLYIFRTNEKGGSHKKKICVDKSSFSLAIVQ